MISWHNVYLVYCFKKEKFSENAINKRERVLLLMNGETEMFSLSRCYLYTWLVFFLDTSKSYFSHTI